MENLDDNSSSENYNGPSHFNLRFNLSSAIIILALLSVLFSIGLFFIIMWRRSMNGEGSTASRSRVAATLGLERTVIESFPVFNYSLVKGLKAQPKGSECAVCLNDFKDEEMARLLPKCSHSFHPECIDMWLCSHTTCPVCRTSLLPADNSNPKPTDFSVVEPLTPPHQVAIVIDKGGFRTDISNEEETIGAPEMIHDSTGHSLVRVPNDLVQPAEWYIATPGSLKPGLYRSCSFVSMHHSQGPSTSNARSA